MYIYTPSKPTSTLPEVGISQLQASNLQVGMGLPRINFSLIFSGKTNMGGTWKLHLFPTGPTGFHMKHVLAYRSVFL